MSKNSGNMSCEDFQAQLAEMVGSGENVSEHEHIRKCELCRALLADLETIAEAARQLFPVEEPPEKLWEKIETAIKVESKNGKNHNTNSPGGTKRETEESGLKPRERNG